jgi:RecQ mediated genome instability protein
VLQIEEIVNVGTNLENRKSDTNATFKVFLTDGKRRIIGLALTPIVGISWKTLPGSKVLITGARLQGGVLLLSFYNCKFLGGKGVVRSPQAIDGQVSADRAEMAIETER